MDTDSEMKYNEDRDDLSVEQLPKTLLLQRSNSETNWNQTMQEFQKKDERRKVSEKKNKLTQKEMNFFQKHFPEQNNSFVYKSKDNNFEFELGTKKSNYQKQGTFTNYQGHLEMPIVSTPTQKRRNFDFNNSFDDISLKNIKFIQNSKNETNSIIRSPDKIIQNTYNKNFQRSDSIFHVENKGQNNQIANRKRWQYVPKNTGDTCYENLHSLYTCLLQIFQGQNPGNEIINLQEHEKSIFQAIIERKFSKILNMNQDYFQIKSELEKIQQQESNKRPEENYKFIFKKCLKHMKQQLKKKMKSKRKIKKKDQEKFFYNYYFKEISEREQIPIEHFFHPKNSKAHKTYKSQNVPKTINMYYIENIKKSQEFVNDFRHYLDFDLMIEYKEQVRTKIESLIQKWNERINELPTIQEAVQEIRDYVLKNKKCKLPWSYKEIQSAIESVKSLFNQFNSSQFFNELFLLNFYNYLKPLFCLFLIKFISFKKNLQNIILLSNNLSSQLTISFQV